MLPLNSTQLAVLTKLLDPRQANQLERFLRWHVQEIKGFIEK